MYEICWSYGASMMGLGCRYISTNERVIISSLLVFGGFDCHIFFCLFILACDLYRYGGVHFPQFSCLKSARWRHVASSPSPSAPACPKKIRCAPRKPQRKVTRRSDHPLLLTCRCREGRRGQEQRQFLPGTRSPRVPQHPAHPLRPPAPPPAPGAPTLTPDSRRTG